jgi:hypothetical protein
MDPAAIQFERRLRTLRDRFEHEIGSENRTCCKAIYLIDRALDAVESDTYAEISHEMDLPSELPKREWCKKCGPTSCGGKR